MRFVVDEAGWNLEGCTPGEASESIRGFVDRLDTIDAREEGVACSREIYEFDVTGDLKLYELLFQETALLSDHDLRLQVSRALDRMPYWEDTCDPPGYDVEIGGRQILAPSIAYAHERVAEGNAMACLPLSSAGRRGPVDVTMDGRTVLVHFVTDEPEHRNFFRSAISVENAGRAAFRALAPSAFPDLEWADDVWGGLGDFSRPFHDIRATVTRHLGVLDDHGIGLFRELLSTHPEEIGARLASAGAPASEENGRTKANARARLERTRTFGAKSRVFWWHTKLQPAVDRIHFLYDSATDRIVVGIFTSHCYLPD